MCGRFSLFTLADVLARRYGLEEVPVYVPRYNIAPTSQVVTVRPRLQGPQHEKRPAGAKNPETKEAGAKEGGGREGVWMHWGIQPGRGEGPLVINARSESLYERPLFRESVASRRCIVPADGFFEWRRTAGGKTPYWFTVGEGPFALAGIWSPRGREGDQEDAQGVEGTGGKEAVEAVEAVGDVVIVTTDSNPLVARVHDRMPVILRRSDEKRWLDPGTPEEEVKSLMAPLPEEDMDCREVPREANDARNEGPELIRPSPQRRLF